MGYAAAAFQLLGSTVQAAGVKREGKNAYARARSQADIERNNALQESYDSIFNESVARANAAEAMVKANAKRRVSEDKITRIEASAAAQLSRQGLDLSSVSFEDVLSQVAVDAELEANNAMYEGAVSAQGFRAEALGIRRRGERAFAIGHHRAKLTTMQGWEALRASRRKASGVMIQGMASAASSVASAQSSGGD